MTFAERYEFVSCRRKHRYSRRPCPQVAANGYKLRAYRCDVCGGWHQTKRPFEIVRQPESSITEVSA